MGYDRKIADREAQARKEADMREKMRSDKVSDSNHKMADIQFKKREKERANRITELRKMEQGEDLDDDRQIDEIYSDSEEEEKIAKERNKLKEPKRWPRAGHKAPNSVSQTIDEESNRYAPGTHGDDDGSSFKQPKPSMIETFDDQPDIFAANEDKPRMPDDESDKEFEQKEQRQDSEKGHQREASGRQEAQGEAQDALTMDERGPGRF